MQLVSNNSTFKCEIISIIGRPNSGKSTLLNKIIGEKITITSPKAQTTRREIRGILEEGNTQLIFIDTPGINYMHKPKNRLESSIVKNYHLACKNSDSSLLVIDSTDTKYSVGQYCIGIDIAVINKIDLIKNKSQLLPIMYELQKHNINNVFPVSSITGEGILKLKEYLLNHAKISPWMYLNSQGKTDQDIKIRLAELTRETIFYRLQCELPYNIYVVTENIYHNEKQLEILQAITVLKNSQKAIVIGKKGKMIQAIREDSVKKMKNIFNKSIMLKLFVKVQENWIDKKQGLIDAGII